MDAATAALLRTLFDEVCEGLPPYDTGARAHVASKMLEAATRGETKPEVLKEIGREALSQAPTMWR